MDVRLAVTADYAAMDVAGKLNVVGFFTNLSPPDYPFTLPMFFVAYWLELGPHECEKEINMEVVLQDEDGHRQVTIGPMMLRTDKPPISGQPAEVPLIFRVDNWQIPGEGTYQCCLLVNDIEKHTMRLRVGPLPAKKEIR